MTARDCLSSLELIELLSSAVDEQPSRREHLKSCRRCSLLASLLPRDAEQRSQELIQGWEASDRLMVRLADGAVQVAQKAPAIVDAPGRSQTRTGDLWLVPVDDDYSEVVAVVGRRQDAPDLLWVAPIAVETEMAADGDVVVDEGPLGYRHLICTWNSGAIQPEQLETYRGRLRREDRVALAESFVAWLGEDRTEPPAGHASIVGSEDPRLAWRAGFEDRTRALFGAVSRRLDQAGPVATEQNEAAATQTSDAPSPAHATRVRTRGSGPTHTETVLFGAYLREQMDREGWDEISLAEKVDLGSLQIKKFLANEFDLQRRRDTAALAMVIRAVTPADAEAERVLDGPLRHSLQLVRGGMPEATSEYGLAQAASSFAGVTDEARDEDINRGLYEVDETPQGHQAAIDTYIAEVRTELA